MLLARSARDHHGVDLRPLRVRQHLRLSLLAALAHDLIFLSDLLLGQDIRDLVAVDHGYYFFGWLFVSKLCIIIILLSHLN